MTQKELYNRIHKDDYDTSPALDASLLIPGSSDSGTRKLMFGDSSECNFTAITDEETGIVAFVNKDLIASKDDIINAYIHSKIKDRMVDETKVSIIPTEETSFGIADEYNIVDEDRNVLHEDVKQCNLERLVRDNNYLVISGEKYL